MAGDDREVIDQALMAIADMGRLCTKSLEIVNQSRQLLRLVDLMSTPLINAPNDHKTLIEPNATGRRSVL